uniref:Zinc finger protein RFP n=1 Tax=Chelonoidis abingdonii TaxID=106734 RepID=A0A8C0J3W5_CHEAB
LEGSPSTFPCGRVLVTLTRLVTCPICLEYFREPVTLECGDNFCRACIAQCWEGSDADFSCPQCRETVQQRNLRLNRQLANVSEIVKELNLHKAKGAGEDGVCMEHQEPLKLFCEEDQTPICVLCDRSQAHRAHTVVLIEEAKQTQIKRHKIVSEFQQLRLFLEEQEQLLLAQLEKLDKKVMKSDKQSNTNLNSEFMPTPLNINISHYHPNTLNPDPGIFIDWTGHSPQVNVILDPDTAHPELLLSEGQKSVRWGDKWQRLPNNPKRFDTLECVLGCEGFTSGRYYWEVEVGGEIIWAVGVARESVRRKGLICFNPEWGIWAVEQWWGEFQALTSPKTPLPLSWVPRRIRVCLDYEQGLVTFLDADNDAPIFTFPPASFNGERIHPWLWVQSEQSQLRLCP